MADAPDFREGRDDPSLTWTSIAKLAFSRFREANDSPTLVSVFESGARYVVVDQGAREIVFDLRALILGIVAAGIEDGESLPFGNTAGFFAHRLVNQVGDERVARALSQRTRPDEALGALRERYDVVLSRSIVRLEDTAIGFAQLTVGRSKFDARHLFAAILDNKEFHALIGQLFGLSLAGDAIRTLKRDLVERVMISPERGEAEAAWLKAFELPPRDAGPPPSPLTPPPSRPRPAEDLVSPFSGDAPSVLGEDLLETKQDIEALAQLVCLDGAAPLALAIFGDWGTGKSTFMARLEERVRTLSEGEARRKRPGSEADSARFVHPVVQIRFNAWHFADANLWAGLTAEFFDQLRAGGYHRKGAARHAELVEKVNLHVHALSDAVSASREAVTRGAKDLRDAQEARDQAAKAARDAPGHTLAQSSIDLLRETYAEQKPRLSALGVSVAADRSSEAVDLIVGVVKDLSSTFGSVKAIWGVLGKTRKRGWALVLLAAVLLVGVGLTAWMTTDERAGAVLAAAVGALGAAVSVAKAVGPALELVRDVAKRGASVAGEVDAQNEKAVSALLAKEIKLKKALAEAKALEEAELTSARALARYIDPKGAANPPRLLRYVLEDDPDTKALEKDIGLIGRARRLFQAVDTIAGEVRKARKAVRDAQRDRPTEDIPDYIDTETPERIVIYIDDLDRCSEDKVYEVLQAVHLLLAFDLFVVVVGVDVRWVGAALARQFEDEQALSEEERAERAVAYLEKIFQVPFWLRPLSPARKARSTAMSGPWRGPRWRRRPRTVSVGRRRRPSGRPENPGPPMEPATAATGRKRRRGSGGRRTRV